MSMTGHIRSTLLASVVGLTMACMPAMAQQSRSPTSCSSSPTTSATATSDPTAAASCAARRRRGSTSSPARVCASRSILVEPGCTPSRAALMTGQYSIRNGLSLIIVPGSPSTLSQSAFTMGELFKGAGYATAIFGKWHLGVEPQSLPTAHGFDEFYGIPPDISWDSATYVDTIDADALDERAARCAAGEGAANRRGRRGRPIARPSSRSRGKSAPRSTMNWWRSRSTS